MQNILVESPTIVSTPKAIQEKKDGRCRMEACLQTVGVWNRNNRMYAEGLLKEGIKKIGDRIKEGSILGELDHPIDNNPVRQLTVLYKDASHQILELGWDGNKLVGVLETTRSPNGEILKNFTTDGIPIGFSFRGMGDLRKVAMEGGKTGYKVEAPLNIVTWDAVSYPSHSEARVIRITEGVASILQESMIPYEIKDGLVCTEDGYCYFPNDFDKLVEQRIIDLKGKYKFTKKSQWLI